MAEEHPTLTMTVANARALADRLYNRGASKLTDGRASEKADLRAAARLIWQVMGSRAPDETFTLPRD